MGWGGRCCAVAELLTLSPDPPGYDITLCTPFHSGISRSNVTLAHSARGEAVQLTTYVEHRGRRTGIYNRAGSSSPFSFLSSTISSTTRPKHQLLSLQPLTRTNQAPWVSLLSAPHRHAPLRSTSPALLTASHAHAVTPGPGSPLSTQLAIAL